MTRPRVLWLGSEVTAQPRSGGALRSARLLAALAAHADVDLVTTEPSDPVPPVASHHPSAKPPRAVVVASALGRSWSLGTARSVSPEAVRVARRLAAGADHVVAEWVHLAPLVPPAGPYVLSVHNVEAERLRDTPPAGDAVRRWFQRRDARLVARAERRLAADPRATVVAVSERDRVMLGGAGHVVENGTDLPPSVTPVPDPGDLVFVGAMGYPPNRDAVEWWAAEVWPLLPDGTPPLTVAGRGAEAALAHLAAHPGVRVVGEVADVGPVLERAALVVVPLRHGGGTRLKVLEAFAAGRPVVSTAKGVEGLDVGDACVVADGAAAFAGAVAGLLADLPQRRRLAAAGRDVAALHDWAVLGARFAEIVLSSPRRRS